MRRSPVRTTFTIIGRRASRSHGRLLASVGVVALLLAACGGDDGEAGEGGAEDSGPVTITWANWADAEQTTRPGLQAIIAKFEEENPDINVESEAIAFTDIAQQLILRTQSGNPPDVASLSGNDLFAVAGTNALAPLDDYVSDDVRSLINEADLESGVYEDQLVGFPWLSSPQGLWYNKKLMEQAGLDPANPPATIDDFMAALEAIKSTFPDVTPLALDTTNRPFGLGSTWAWMKTFGAEPFEGTEATADSPEMLEYLSWLREMSENGYIIPGKKIGEYRPLAAQDQVAFMWDQDVLQSVVQDTNGMSDEDFYATWGVAPLPKGPADESFSVNMGSHMVIFNESEHKEAAWKFIEYMSTSQDAVIDFTIGTGAQLPPLASPEGAVATLLDTPVKQAFLNDIFPTFTNPPYGQAYSEAYAPIMAGVQQVVTSDADVGQIAEDIQSQLESVLG